MDFVVLMLLLNFPDILLLLLLLPLTLKLCSVVVLLPVFLAVFAAQKHKNNSSHVHTEVDHSLHMLGSQTRHDLLTTQSTVTVGVCSCVCLGSEGGLVLTVACCSGGRGKSRSRSVPRQRGRGRGGSRGGGARGRVGEPQERPSGLRSS